MCMPPAHDPGALAERRWRAVDLPRIRRLDDSWEIRLSWHGHSPRGRRGLCSSGDRPRMLRSISRRSCSGPISGRFPAPISRERSADRSNRLERSVERSNARAVRERTSNARAVRKRGVAWADRPGTRRRTDGPSGNGASSGWQVRTQPRTPTTAIVAAFRFGIVRPAVRAQTCTSTIAVVALAGPSVPG